MSREPTVSDLLAAAAERGRLPEVHQLVRELLGSEAVVRAQRRMTRRIMSAGTRRW